MSEGNYPMNLLNKIRNLGTGIATVRRISRSGIHAFKFANFQLSTLAPLVLATAVVVGIWFSFHNWDWLRIETENMESNSATLRNIGLIIATTNRPATCDMAQLGGDASS